MKKKFFAAETERYSADATVARGYTILDWWNDEGLTSLKIVEQVERAVADLRAKGTREAHLEALSYLFALDKRIKERYNSIWRCLFSYFSWRRERRAMQRLCSELHIQSGAPDILSEIELELAKLREELVGEGTEDDEDGARGGRQNGLDEAEAAVETAEAEQISEENIEEAAELEENAEESSVEEVAETEDAPTEEAAEQTEEIGEPHEEIAEVTAENAAESAEPEKTQAARQEEQKQAKEENNGPEESSEPIEDTNKKVKADEGAIDVLPIDAELVIEKKKEEKLSFIDEVIIDNMVKGKEDFVSHNPLEDGRNERLAREEAELDADRERLFDDLSPDGDLPLTDSAERTDSQVKSETARESQNQPPRELEITPDNEREQIQVDMTAELENEMAGEINNSLTDEMVQYIKAAMEIEAKEQMRIASEELGIDAPVEVIGKTDMAELEKSHTAPNKQ